MLFENDNSQNNNEVKLVTLKTINDNFELGIIESILIDNLIPYILHDSGSGGYMRLISGSPIFGTDILVSEDDYEKANELIEGIV